jgi:predicted NUDIX family phosphoesterase
MSENVRTISQKSLEEYINENEEAGQMLNALGVISDEELVAGVHKMEEFRVRILADANYAEKEAEELEETGSVADADPV